MDLTFGKPKQRAALAKAAAARKERDARRKAARVASQLQNWARGAMQLYKRRAALAAQLVKRCADTHKVLLMLRAKTQRPTFALPLKAVLPLIGLAWLVVRRDRGQPVAQLPPCLLFEAIAPSVAAAQLALVAGDPAALWRLRWLIDLAQRDLARSTERGIARASYVAINALGSVAAEDAASGPLAAGAALARSALARLDLRRWTASLNAMRAGGEEHEAALFAAALAPFAGATTARQRARAAEVLLAGPFAEWGGVVVKRQWAATAARLARTGRLRGVAEVAWGALASRALARHAERSRAVAINCATLAVLCAMAVAPAEEEDGGAARARRVAAAFLERGKLHIRLREWNDAVADSSRALSVVRAPATPEEIAVAASARMLRAKAFQRQGRRTAARADLEHLVALGSGATRGVGLELWRLASRDLKLLVTEVKSAARSASRVKRAAKRSARKKCTAAAASAAARDLSADEAAAAARDAAARERKREKRREKRARQKERKRAARDAAEAVERDAVARARGAPPTAEESAAQKAASAARFRSEVALLQCEREAQRAAGAVDADAAARATEADATAAIQRVVDAVREATKASEAEALAAKRQAKRERAAARLATEKEEEAAAAVRAKASEDAAWESVLFDALTGFSGDAGGAGGKGGWEGEEDDPWSLAAILGRAEEEESEERSSYSSGDYDSGEEESEEEARDAPPKGVLIDGVDVGYAHARTRADGAFFSTEGVELALAHFEDAARAAALVAPAGSDAPPRAVAMLPRRLVAKFAEDDEAFGAAVARLEARGAVVVVDLSAEDAAPSFAHALAENAAQCGASLVSNDHELLATGATALNYTFAGDVFILLDPLY